jgi:hypothetical protein
MAILERRIRAWFTSGRELRHRRCSEVEAFYMGSRTGDAYSESLEVIKTIKKAWEKGHTLVPLLGAGISVDSGMPLVDSIMLYLVMIRQYVRLKAYRPQYEAAPYGNIDKSGTTAGRTASSFVTN